MKHCFILLLLVLGVGLQTAMAQSCCDKTAATKNEGKSCSATTTTTTATTTAQANLVNQITNPFPTSKAVNCPTGCPDCAASCDKTSATTKTDSNGKKGDCTCCPPGCCATTSINAATTKKAATKTL